MSEPLAEDDKLVALARAARARTGAAEGAAVRDLDGRTYAGASVSLPSLSISALGVCVAMAVSSGSRGLEAVVVMAAAAPDADSDAAAPARVRGRQCRRASRLTWFRGSAVDGLAPQPPNAFGG